MRPEFHLYQGYLTFAAFHYEMAIGKSKMCSSSRSDTARNSALARTSQVAFWGAHILSAIPRNQPATDATLLRISDWVDGHQATACFQ